MIKTQHAGTVFRQIFGVYDLNTKYKIKKPFSNPLAYKLRGKVIDSSKSIVQVFDFKISLEYDYPDGMNEEFTNNDYVEFFASRLDCIIENYY